MQVVSIKDWLTALKSGEYKQTDGALHDRGEDAYCCLGVACKLSNVEEITRVSDGREVTLFKLPSDLGDYFFYESMPSSCFLEKLHLNGFGFKVARYNDNGYTFEQIADLLTFYYWANGITGE